ncbi:MAG TPA: hypothetical protein VF388_03955 [Lacunisphaera sp.]
MDRRAVGWLNAGFHAAFRELALHAAIRESLYCPIYTLMPDHFHLIWMGVAADSDQRLATRFLRSQLGKELKAYEWQHQPHDRVLRDDERKQGALMKMVRYIAENPVRAGLANMAEEWRYTGCVVPGYPELHPLSGSFWDMFWRFYRAATAQGVVGKLPLDAAKPAV